jgi:hypothetical protein
MPHPNGRAEDLLNDAYVWLDRASTLANADLKAVAANTEAVTARLHVLHELAMCALNVSMNRYNLEQAEAQNEANRRAATGLSVPLGGVPVGPTALRRQ